MSEKLTEEDVIAHVCEHGEYRDLPTKSVYSVSWKGKAYRAEDTRDLVVAICKDEGIRVRK